MTSPVPFVFHPDHSEGMMPRRCICQAATCGAAHAFLSAPQQLTGTPLVACAIDFYKVIELQYFFFLKIFWDIFAFIDRSAEEGLDRKLSKGPQTRGRCSKGTASVHGPCSTFSEKF